MSTQPLDPGQLPDMLDFDLDKTLITQLPTELQADNRGLTLVGKDSETLLTLAPLIMGRDESCTLTLPSRRVSRYHAAIYAHGKQHLIRDLHSTNGVRVNDKPVAQAILRTGDRIRLGDRHFKLTENNVGAGEYRTHGIVVFLDLADSTRLTEKYGKAFSNRIRLAMRKLEDQVLIHRGCPVKLLGDGLMAAFDLYPVKELRYHPYDAALQFAHKALRLFSKLESPEPLRLRVGLHAGDVVVAEVPQFDLFGDTVNTAARLESSNKYYDTNLMVSQSFYEQSRFKAYLREVDRVKVMGRDMPITLYTWNDHYAKHKDPHFCQPYERALEAYRAGEWDTARSIWERGSANDPLCNPMLRRLSQLKTLPSSWQGVWSLDK